MHDFVSSSFSHCMGMLLHIHTGAKFRAIIFGAVVQSKLIHVDSNLKGCRSDGAARLISLGNFSKTCTFRAADYNDM